MRRLLPATLLLLATLAPAVAAAQSSEADRSTARLLAQEGRDALRRKDYAVAADRFGRADALVHAPTLLLDLGRARAGLGQLISAQDAYSRIVREGAPPGAPPVFLKALASAREELDALTPRIPTVTVTVKGPASATVTLDGQALPSAALGAKRAVDPGKHVLRARADGFAVSEATVTLSEGQAQAVTLELVAASAVVAPVVVPVPVRVVVTPAAPPPLVPAPPPAPAHRPWQSTAGLAALGVGGAGLVLGAVTGGLFLGQRSTLASKGCSNGICPPSEASSLQSYQLYGSLSTAGFVVAGVGAATGTILLLAAPKWKPSTVGGASLLPVIGLGTLGAQGTF